MRKQLIIIGIIVIAVIAGLFIAWEAFSYKNVQVEMKENGYVVDVFTSGDQKVTSVTQSGEIKLKEGSYSYKVIGTSLDASSVDFEVVGNDTKITVQPSLSESRLLELADEERSSILAILSSDYPDVGFKVDTIELYQMGEWASGTLTLNTDPRQVSDIYRFVLNKKDDIWTLVVRPQIAINKAAYKNVPQEILYGLYSED